MKKERWFELKLNRFDVPDLEDFEDQKPIELTPEQQSAINKTREDSLARIKERAMNRWQT